MAVSGPAETPVVLPLETTDDAFLGGALRLLQPRHGYRAGLDAILLAAACPQVTGTAQRILDCGAGVGAVGLAVARRVGDAQVTLVERDTGLAGLAARNAIGNGLGDRCRVIVADVAAPLSRTPDLAALAGQFDHVLANPPFHAHARGTRPTDVHKDASHAMPDGALDDWLRFAAALAREGGTLTMIHRPDVLPDLLAACGRRFGGLTLLSLHPRAGAPASRVLVQGIRGSRAGLTILAPRILHAPDGHGFTPEFDAILRASAPLALSV